MNKFFISHRGNISGKNTSFENNPDYIEDQVLPLYDCEVDLRLYDKKFFLGHDNLDYEVSEDWLIQHSLKLWIHCKNFESLNYFLTSKSNLNFFWHQEDRFTLTSKGFLWTYPGESYSNNSIIVDNTKELKNLSFLGVCSDYVEFYYKNFKSI